MRADVSKTTPMALRQWTVYIHTFPDGTKYIGATSQAPERRWAKGKGYVSQSSMKEAIEKFGWENVQHEIVAVFDTKEEAYAEEIRLIELYQTRDPEHGHNSSIGGEKGAYGVIRNEAVRQKMSQVRKGHGPPEWVTAKAHEAKRNWVVPLETRQRMSDAQRGEKNHEYGKPKPQEIIDKLRNNSPRNRRVRCVETGEVFISLSDAARKSQIKDSGCITRCCKNERQTAGGFHWEYADV